jgi:hypothetical protein
VDGKESFGRTQVRKPACGQLRIFGVLAIWNTVRLLLISWYNYLISEPPFPSWERRFFCWRPRDKGWTATKGEKNEKQKQEVLKRNLQFF